MSDEPMVDWKAAALAGIELQITKLQAAADIIRELGGTASGRPLPGGDAGGVGPGAFLKMSIGDATKKHLETVREKQSTKAIVEALPKGGLPVSKYNTIYASLRRRETQVGDIINMDGDWALAEWYPNYRKGNKAKGTNAADEATA